MSTVLLVLNRYVAPFASGLCMAAATAVDKPVAVAAFVGLAGLFAFYSFDAGGRMIERITDGALERSLGGSFGE